MMSEKSSKAVDLSHHLSELSKARRESPLKGLARFMGDPNLITLAGGMPHPSYFPFSAIHVDGLATDSFALQPKAQSSSLSWLWNIFSVKEKTIPFTIPKYPTHLNEVNLAVALQYGSGEGLEQMAKVVRDFTAKVYQPAYSDWTALCHVGNTDAWSRVVQTVCNPGEIFLAEEWTYSSALASSGPINVRAAPVAVDGEGMRSDDLRKVLAEWDEPARGAKRPHVLYTIPIGQNPTGGTMGLKRKQEIYDICVEYDVVIVEDDPYYFIQMGNYVPKAARAVSGNVSRFNSDADEFVASLVPSFLKIDTQGRVIRLDTFSKTIAPGSRLGWFTCNPVFAERLLVHGQTSVQNASGLSQALIGQLLITWGHDGYIRWLRGLVQEYTNRRDFFIDSIAEEFHLRTTSDRQDFWKGCEVYDAYPRSTTDFHEKYAFGQTRLFSFVAPTAGMFIWIKFNFDFHPSILAKHTAESLEVQLWEKLAEGGVLFAPGWFFAADQEAPPNLPTEGHYRVSFSNAEYPAMKKAVQLFASISQSFLQEIAT